MHASIVPAEIIERTNARRGQAIPIAVDPAKTAHVVVDLQVGFMGRGAIGEVPVAREIVPQVNRISQALRDAGGINVFLRFTVDLEEPDPWSSMWGRMSAPAVQAFVDAFRSGAEQHQIW
ncbi:MAG TPA: hypothetical protein VN806_00480, partial [Caulobacteraceae bacterium]|nr:hypothetical protein [Caulobacteraceae bacterium]